MAKLRRELAQTKAELAEASEAPPAPDDPAVEDEKKKGDRADGKQAQKLKADLRSSKSKLKQANAEIDRLESELLQSTRRQEEMADGMDAAASSRQPPSHIEARLENEIDRARAEANDWKQKYETVEAKMSVLARSHSMLRKQQQGGAKKASPSKGRFSIF